MEVVGAVFIADLVVVDLECLLETFKSGVANLACFRYNTVILVLSIGGSEGNVDSRIALFVFVLFWLDIVLRCFRPMTSPDDLSRSLFLFFF